MNEIVPLLYGALLGFVLGSVKPSRRSAVAVPLAVVLGVCASAITGELRIGWEYVLVDIPLVALFAAACFAARSRRRRATAKDPYA